MSLSRYHQHRSLAVLAAAALLCSNAWSQMGVDFELLPALGPSGEFGAAVALDAGVVVVGSPSGDGVTAGTGSVSLFDAVSGAKLHDLTALDGAASDQFGFSVAIADGRVVVGAHLDDDNGSGSGAAYLFDAATGAQLSKLLASDGAPGDEFGFAVAIDDGIVAVGANRDDDHGLDSGSVYLFDASTGAQLDKLHASDAGPIANFGEALDMDGGTLAVGAHGDDQNGLLAGAAYLFDVATGAQLAKLVASDGGSNDFLGASIALDGGVAVVGAWADSIFFDHSGSAYLFDVDTGAQIEKLVPSDGHDRDHFGYSVAIDDGVVAIGAELDDDTAFNAGSAYLYSASDGTPLGKILASDGAVHDSFGFAIAIEDGVIVIGAPEHDQVGSDAGSAYVLASGLAATREEIRSGSPPNPTAFLPGMTSGPSLGSTWDPFVDHTTFFPTAALDILFISKVPGAINVPSPVGTLLCDLSSFLARFVVAGDPFSLSIPSDSSLAGLELSTQAASFDALGALVFANAIDITLGSL